MKAFVIKKMDPVGFVDKPIPNPGSDGAVIKTKIALMNLGLPHVHTVHGAIGRKSDPGSKAVGMVYEVGSEVKLFKPGDRVVVGAKKITN
jgi:NADPH:quinone reductase-like Zn-dependent oxidoreductase